MANNRLTEAVVSKEKYVIFRRIHRQRFVRIGRFGTQRNEELQSKEERLR